MRDVVLFIAMSLDGYIADSRGGVDWLGGQDEDRHNVEEENCETIAAKAGADDSYAAFVKGVDTVVMGWNTYHQIVTELSPEAWVYSGLESYVLTRRDAAACNGAVFAEKVAFCNQSPCALVRRLRRQPGKDIWICGGAQIAQQLIAENLISRYHISVIPVILGKGIRLFGEAEEKIRLRLVKVRSSGGITELLYEKRGEAYDCN